MLSFKEALRILESSTEYKEFKEKNPEVILSYGFYMVEEADDSWKIGYYHEKKDKITSFNVGETINIEPQTQIFKKEKDKVQGLTIEEIKLDLAEAVTVATNLQKEEYATEDPTKIIAILQKLKNDQVWNITFVTKNFNTLNFKIKADSGRVIEKKLTNVMQFKKSNI